MRLTDRTDFTLRVLMLTAASRERHTVAWMANALAVSAHHLNKIVQTLQSLGWVTTVPGRGGGVALAIEAGRLRVGDVVRAIEPDMNLVECLREQGECPLSGPCRLVGALREARSAFLAALDGVTLEDLVRDREARLVHAIVTTPSIARRHA